MPRLIVTSHFSRDSRQLRQTAEQLGWETCRVDRTEMPDWLKPQPDLATAIYGGIPTVFEIARHLQQVMLGLPAGWLAALPAKFLRRPVELSSAESFLAGSREMFVKPTCSKAFPAGVYAPATLEPLVAELDASFPVYLAEPVTWTMEFRAFILNGTVETISAYRYQGRYLTNYDQPLKVSANHQRAARSFAERFLEACSDSSPPAFVLDVGYIAKRGWAVIEGNECCASGIYTCDPASVLKVLLQGTMPLARLTEADRRWDFEPHYYDAFAPRRNHAATIRRPASSV